MESSTKKQKIQEAGYSFPYHYLDLKVDEYRLILHVEYLSYLNIVKNLLKPFTGQSVLDAGCGDGRFCYELKDKNVKIVGIDFSERAIAFAKVFNPDGEFYIKDLKNLKLPYKFDYMVLIETLEHIIPSEISLILENLSNILKKDGKLIITVPSVNISLIEKHYQHFTKESLIDAVKDYFTVIKCVGYSRIGLHRKIFSKIRSASFLLFPLGRKIKLINKWFEYLKKYYEVHFAIGKPEECNGIVAVCEKKS